AARTRLETIAWVQRAHIERRLPDKFKARAPKLWRDANAHGSFENSEQVIASGDMFMVNAKDNLEYTATAAGALQLAKQFSLLLKESPQKIVKEIQSTGGPLATPVSTFIDKARPTKSFYKISVANQISLADIQLLSRHLIYWRRAIAIPPLHHRDTYIVSPNADMSKLVEASKSFEMAFPMMPSLPRILSLLSQTPAPFGTLIPSSDHKGEYYRVLAWLMRGGWVTQLRTF
ncbi:MAG: Nitrogen permease regulator 3, partial [Watsoniomyces obsoletus]